MQRVCQPGDSADRAGNDEDVPGAAQKCAGSDEEGGSAFEVYGACVLGSLFGSGCAAQEVSGSCVSANGAGSLQTLLQTLACTRRSRGVVAKVGPGNHEKDP